MLQRQAGERAAERAVHQRRAAAVEPVEAQHAVGAGGRFRPPRRSSRVEVFVPERAAQPVEGVADGGLAGFVAEVAGQDAAFDDARDAGHESLVASR